MKPKRTKPGRVRRQAQRQAGRLVTARQAAALRRWFALGPKDTGQLRNSL